MMFARGLSVYKSFRMLRLGPVRSLTAVECRADTHIDDHYLRELNVDNEDMWLSSNPGSPLFPRWMGHGTKIDISQDERLSMYPKDA